MRTVLGYRDGHTLWSENTPSEAWSHDLGGSQIVTKSFAHSKPEPDPKRDYPAAAAKGWETRRHG